MAAGATRGALVGKSAAKAAPDISVPTAAATRKRRMASPLVGTRFAPAKEEHKAAGKSTKKRGHEPYATFNVLRRGGRVA
jgi:hypothetical protein